MKIKVYNSEKDCSFENISILISKLLSRSPQKSMSLQSSVFVSSSRKPHQNVVLNNNKNSNLNIVSQNAQNRLYNTFLNTILCIQTKNRKQKHIIYITPYFNVTLRIKTKNRKHKHNTGLYDRNRKKRKSSLQAQKKSTIKIKILSVSFQGNLQCLSVSLFLQPFACIHPLYFLLQQHKYQLLFNLHQLSA